MKLLALAALAAATSLSAQDVRCILVEGAALPGLPGFTAGNLKKTGVNQLGGYACMVDALDAFGVTNGTMIWGHASGAPGAPLRTQEALGFYVQVAFDNFFGIDDQGRIAYGAQVIDTISGLSFVDSVWLDDALLAIEGAPIPSLPGKVWHQAGWIGGLGRAGITRDGQPFWTGGIQDALTGADEGEGVFLGLSATPLYKTGDVPPGAPAAITFVDFDLAVSAYGSHHATVVRIDTEASEDSVVVIDGAALLAGGAIVQEGQPVPASIGGLPGEVWGAFDLFGINENGDWLVTGDTGGDEASDEIVLVNGAILHREGDVLDGRTLAGSIEGAALSETGEVALVWAVDDPAGDREALILEGEVLLLEGDAIDVDVDGDGAPEPGAVITDFTIPPALALGADRTLYFTVLVDHLGSATSIDDVECYCALTPDDTPDLVASPPALSVSLGGTQALFVRPGAALAGQTYWVAGSISGTAPGFALGGFAIPLNPDAYFLATILKPNQPPLVDTLGTLGESGALARWELAAGALTSAVGITADHAYLVLDPLTLAPSHVSQTASLAFVL